MSCQKLEIMSVILNKMTDEKIKTEYLNTVLLNNVKSNFEIIKFAIDNGADIAADNYYILNLYLKAGHLQLIKYLIEEKGIKFYKKYNSLSVCAETYQYELMKYLIEKGANINQDDYYILKHCCEKGNYEMVKYLVGKGADIHKNNDIYLRKAVMKGHLEIVKFLIENGANVTAIDKYTLKYILLDDNIEMLELLIQKGLNINIFDDSCLKNILKQCLSMYSFTAAKFLIENGVVLGINKELLCPKNYEIYVYFINNKNDKIDQNFYLNEIVIPEKKKNEKTFKDLKDKINEEFKKNQDSIQINMNDFSNLNENILKEYICQFNKNYAEWKMEINKDNNMLTIS